MFRKARIGDKVWDYTKGWGIISNDCLIQNNRDFPVIVEFKNSTKESYSFDGKKHYEDLNPSLFWDEIKFEVPEKPFNLKEFLKEHLEPKEFEYNEKNYFLYWSVREEEFDFSYASFHKNIEPYFKRDNLQIVVDTLNGEYVTLEDLKQAFKELEWI